MEHRASRRTRFGFGGAFLLVAVTSISGCTETTTSSSELPASIELSVSTDPISATPSVDTAFDWVAELTLTVTETSGTGADISTISADINEASGGILIETGEDEEFRVNVTADGARVEANGIQTVTLSIEYTLPGGGREAVIGVTVTTIDDIGFSDQAGVTAEVQ